MPRPGRVLVAVSIALLVACSPAAEQDAAEPAVSAAPASITQAGDQGQVRGTDNIEGGQVVQPAGGTARPAARPQRSASPARSVRSPVPPPASRKSGLTPGESPFMESADTLGGSMITEMRGERWDESVARFEADAMADPDAGELQQVYEQALRESLSAQGLHLGRFGCGLSLCAGTILGPLEDGEARYGRWSAQDLDLPLPMFVQTTADNALHMEVRFTFSTDPGAQSIIIRR